ncbi:CHASE2 domain-containing protein [Dyella jejuensis]|uniref:histidine kinase n=1 Tax=Dyella jejuensis TaxID=1432009 RepID=A0ABW8JHC3_9GAMM
MLPLRAIVRRLSRTAKARILFIGFVLVLAALSGHPLGASMSGALDKVLFDLSTRWFSHPGTQQVAVVLIDGKTLREYGTDGLTARTGELLERLDRAASVTLDYALASDTHTGELAAVMARNGNVVLPVSGNALEQSADALPTLLRAQAAGRGQRHFTVGHYGAVNGFVPYLPPAQGATPNIVLEAIRVAGAQHARPQAHQRAYALSVAATRKDAVLVMMSDPAHVPQYSFSDVIDGRVPADAFASKMVFVGDAVGEDAGFRISSLHMDAVSRAQLDALVADAVVSGNMASELPVYMAIPIYLAIALGMVLICLLVRGGWMHAAAYAWGVLMLLLPMLLLGSLHRWLGLGLLPLVCVLIYAHFAWERLRRTQNLLQREIGKLRAIRATVGVAAAGGAAPPPMQARRDPLEQIRHAMREIRAWQSTFVSMINQLPYPVFVVDNGQVSVWNAKAAEMMAAPGEDGMSLPEVQRLVATHCSGEESASEEVTLGGREHMLLYVPYASADSSLHPGVAEGRASFLACLIDIAGIKEGVTHDRQALRHIAHDLRSPLSTILSLIEERAEGHRRDAPPDRAFLDDLRRQADYSLRVAKDFLQLSRAEQLRRDAFAPVALLDMAAEAIDQLWPAAENKSIELIGPECGLDDTLLRGNADMLIRALVNVIDNALKYSPPHTTITLRIVDDGDSGMLLHIVDQGIGIAEEDLAHLFDPFFQVAGKPEVDMGVGLGLPFVKTVIERHGGSITVASQPGQGTDVRIALPRA